MIKTAREYREGIAALDRLMKLDPSPSSRDGAQLELLAKRLEAYEKIHFPIPKPTAAEVKAFRKEQEKKPNLSVWDYLDGSTDK